MAVPTKRKAVRFITRDDHRLYIHPVTGEFIPGVTSTIDNLPKPFLKAWGQKLVAQEAIAKFDQFERLKDANPEAAEEWLKKAPNRFTAHAAKIGKISHGYFEELALGNEVSTADEEDDVKVMVDHFKHYLDTMQPTFLLLEEGVYDEDLDYAGTFDAIARYNNPDMVIRDSFGNESPLVGVAWQDNKTTRSGVHPEVGLQLAAYRYAKYMIREDGSLINNKPGDFALVLHVRPEGWELVPVEAGPEELAVFTHLRAITDYTRTHSKKIIHAPVAGNRIRRRRGSKE
ncbi:Cas4 family exonuclease [Microbacterium phage Franklin22]|uniref:Cas4 family exonuclease n=1 Tax=Microbacterium phage Franklin22 TaxID=2894293 RepID=UPI001E760031|nr:Cas4 family exonuclease [Microbacterium phage Franklin22]UGL61839.1 Cas4 family exonuclease [Microbacterium phage Franklin22]